MTKSWARERIFLSLKESEVITPKVLQQKIKTMGPFFTKLFHDDVTGEEDEKF